MAQSPAVEDRQRLARIQCLWVELQAARTDPVKYDAIAERLRREADAFRKMPSRPRLMHWRTWRVELLLLMSAYLMGSTGLAIWQATVSSALARDGDAIVAFLCWSITTNAVETSHTLFRATERSLLTGQPCTTQNIMRVLDR